MDMLSVRYACPFFILDEFISLGQFHDFVDVISEKIVEEKKEDVQWDFFLHKVFDKTYKEYLDSITVDPKTSEMSNKEIKDVVDESRNILDSFSF